MYENIFFSVDYIMLKIPLQFMAFLNQSAPALPARALPARALPAPENAFSFSIQLFIYSPKLTHDINRSAKKYNAPDCKH